MKKPKYITAENYQQFLPSELVRSFISDIDVAIKIGKPMDMYAYHPIDAEKGCLPCLGGMACLNMGISPSIVHSEVGHSISRIGDRIRQGESLTEVVYYLRTLYPSINFTDAEYSPALESTQYFKGVLKTRKLKALKSQVEKYATALEQAGV